MAAAAVADIGRCHTQAQTFLIQNVGDDVDEVTLVKSSGGVFEITLDDEASLHTSFCGPAPSRLVIHCSTQLQRITHHDACSA